MTLHCRLAVCLEVRVLIFLSRGPLLDDNDDEILIVRDYQFLFTSFDPQVLEVIVWI